MKRFFDLSICSFKRPLGFALMAPFLLAVAACAEWFPPTPQPDYAIRVAPTVDGRGEATPPPCPAWSEAVTNPFDNQPYPQYGCAHARNLAAMAERPEDLVEGRKLANQRGVLAVGAVRRYDNNQTRGLVMPSADTNSIAATTASSPSSSMTGDITAGGAPGAGGAAAAAP